MLMERINNLICDLEHISEKESEVYPISYTLLKEFSHRIKPTDFKGFMAGCYEKFDSQFSEIITVYLSDRLSSLDFSDWKDLLQHVESSRSVFSIFSVLWKYYQVDIVSSFCESSKMSHQKKHAAIHYLRLNKMGLRVKYVDRDDINAIENKYNFKFDFTSYKNKLIEQGAKILPESHVERQQIIDHWITIFDTTKKTDI